MIRKSAVWAGNPYEAAGCGDTTTPAVVVAGLPVVELVVDDDVDLVTSGVPPGTTFPLLHDDCVVS